MQWKNDYGIFSLLLLQANFRFLSDEKLKLNRNEDVTMQKYAGKKWVNRAKAQNAYKKRKKKYKEEKNKIKMNSISVYQLLTIRASFEQSVNHCMVLFLLFLLMQDTLDRVKDRVFQCKMCVCMMRYILFGSLEIFAIMCFLVFFAAFDSVFFLLSFVLYIFLFLTNYTMTWFAICRSIRHH